MFKILLPSSKRMNTKPMTQQLLCQMPPKLIFWPVVCSETNPPCLKWSVNASKLCDNPWIRFPKIWIHYKTTNSAWHLFAVCCRKRAGIIRQHPPLLNNSPARPKCQPSHYKRRNIDPKCLRTCILPNSEQLVSYLERHEENEQSGVAFHFWWMSSCSWPEVHCLQ